MNSTVALGSFVVVSAIFSACLAEPDGIHRERTESEQGGEAAAAAGRSSGDASPSVACEALGIIQMKCGRCHASPPLFGAPFPLLTFDDLAEVDKGRVRRERMVLAIERGSMPATFFELDPPVEELTEDERALLLDWLASDPEASGPCDE